jgi:hypothetical protein
VLFGLRNDLSKSEFAIAMQTTINPGATIRVAQLGDYWHLRAQCGAEMDFAGREALS